MTILDALGSAEYRQHITLLATLIKLSYADGHLDEREWEIIQSVALKYGLNDPEGLKFLRKNYQKYSLDTPFSLDERIDQLYQLTRLVFADQKADENELKILRRAIIGLGFPVNKADLIYQTALDLVRSGKSKAEFDEVIRRLL